METASPSMEQDYERMLLSHEKKKLRLRLSHTRCGDLILLAFISIASLFSVISLTAQTLSFQLTRVVTGYNLTCTLFVDYKNGTYSSQSPIYCYSSIGVSALVLVGLLTHSLFLALKCCFNRVWKCLESLHALIGLVLLASSVAVSILLSLGFQHTCDSLLRRDMTCDVIEGVAYKDLMRQAPTSQWLTSFLLVFIEIIFLARTGVYCVRCVQTGRLGKSGNGCMDCSWGKKLRR